MTTTQKASIQDEANKHYGYFAAEAGRQIRIMEQANDHGHYGIAESILDRIREDPLSLSINEVDPSGDEVKWSLLLGWGGPAVRILVTTDLNGCVEDADYQFQDWFTPWTSADDQDRDMVRAYADVFYYGQIRVTQDGMPIY